MDTYKRVFIIAPFRAAYDIYRREHGLMGNNRVCWVHDWQSVVHKMYGHGKGCKIIWIEGDSQGKFEYNRRNLEVLIDNVRVLTDHGAELVYVTLDR